MGIRSSLTWKQSPTLRSLDTWRHMMALTLPPLLLPVVPTAPSLLISRSTRTTPQLVVSTSIRPTVVRRPSIISWSLLVLMLLVSLSSLLVSHCLIRTHLTMLVNQMSSSPLLRMLTTWVSGHHSLGSTILLPLSGVPSSTPSQKKTLPTPPQLSSIAVTVGCTFTLPTPSALSLLTPLLLLTLSRVVLLVVSLLSQSSVVSKLPRQSGVAMTLSSSAAQSASRPVVLPPSSSVIQPVTALQWTSAAGHATIMPTGPARVM